MRYTILTKGDSKSNALKHKMMNYMKDFRMIEDMKILKLLFQLVVMVHYYKHSISIATCYQKWHLLEFIQVI